jgi:predicted nucleic acid-binding protein
MSGSVFLDTKILIYATLSSDSRASVAAALLAAGGVVSVQVLNEFVSTARRKLNRSWREISTALGAFRKLCPDIRDLGVATHERALDLAQQHGFAFYDALIVASALDAGCTTLLTEHLQHGRVIDDKLTIRNPFAGSGLQPS